jgi:hypothetical protein
MPEQLRDQLPNPSLYSNALTNADSEAGRAAVDKNAVALSAAAEGKPLVATQDYEPIAYDVAHAIKPDVDAVVDLNAAKKEHDPLAQAATVLIDGKPRLTGVTEFAQSKELNAAQADLDRNAKYAAEIAAKQHLGAEALALVESKQKVMSMNLR